MKDIIHSLKYERRRSIAPPLGQLMRERGAALLRDAAVVVPVPLHPRREYERGVPVMPLLKRIVFTRSQIELPKDQRHENVKDAFGFRPSALGVIPQIVVLVDDVSTTGATLEACARVLKTAGVREVRALTAARVVHERR
jgi:predicted amidophosphoribosyltransferase